MPDVHPGLEPIADLFDEMQSALDERGFVAEVGSHGGVTTEDGDLGIRLDVRSPNADDPRRWSLSVDLDADASNLLTVLVDGVLNAESGNAAPVPMPSDLHEWGQHIADWFLSMHVPPSP